MTDIVLYNYYSYKIHTKTILNAYKFLFLYSLLQGLLRPVISTYANRHIEESYRATVISVQSMIATIAAALLLFLFGFLTDSIGINNPP